MELPPENPIDEAMCDFPCPGNPNEICGGVWINSIYQIAEVMEERPFCVTKRPGATNLSYKMPASHLQDPYKSFQKEECFKNEFWRKTTELCKPNEPGC